MNNFLIIGAGFSGAVIAERLVNSLDCRVLVIDERQHIGGNCHTARDESTGVMVHTYGPHIFNTDNEEVWNYLQQFGEFVPFVYRVKAVHNGQVYSLPVNLHTINQLFGKSFNPKEAEAFIASLADNTIAEPKNFEEQALKFLGEKLYRAFFYGYTKKQWGCEPRELPASILKRLPVRFNYNDNYYSNHIQAMPRDGYTAIFESMLTHPNIEVKLNTKFDDGFDTNGFEHIFYSGPIDAFFKYKHGRLSYRTVSFERNEGTGDFQGNAQINYTDESVPFTRIVEHKHFTPWEQHEKTVYFKEYSKETEADDVPFYPKRLSADMEKLKLYQQELATLPNYTFLGRLATYRYMDMHHVIAEALQKAKEFIEQYKLELWPK
ncbi:MAG: UDP-galactopyranose mutase [Chitinophagaceae bacterium]|nr:UDP-galactopyranose mutase [Chitinophagaceae bacterium]